MNGRWEKAFMVLASVWGIIRVVAHRPRIVVFGTDMIGAHPHEPRMARVYEWLEFRRVPYAHLVHAAPHGRVVQHWFQRRRPVVYLEALGYLRVPLSWLFRKSGARQLWAIDDYRHWRNVVVAARRADVRSVLFQHGRFTRHQPYLAFPGIPPEDIPLPDVYIVWNAYWRDKLMSISPIFRQHPAVLRIGGKPSADVVVPRGERVVPDGKLRVMLLHEPAAPSEQVRAFVDRLSGAGDVVPIYKVRGDQSVQNQLAHHGLGERMRSGRWTVTPDLAAADLVLGSYSTLLYEVIQAGVPVAVLKMSSMQTDDLIEDGLASRLDPAADLSGELDRAARVKEMELSRRADVLRVSVAIEDTLDNLLCG